MQTSSNVNRAGMLAFNRAGEVLLISDLGCTGKWMFPKGHIEKDETPVDAAVREAREEAGVDCYIDSDDPVGTTAYNYRGEDIVVEWWAGIATKKHEIIDMYDEAAWRSALWVRPEIALEMLSFPSLRNILRKAVCIDKYEEEQ